MTYTLEQWIIALCAAIGNLHPSKIVIAFIAAWTFREGWGSAAYNLLNTTEGNPQFGGFEGVNIQGPARAAGVKDFPSFEQGVDANAFVLKNGRYPHLLAAIAGNRDSDLLIPSQAISDEMKVWSGGSDYGRAIATLARAGTVDLGHEFPGQGPASPPVTPPVKVDVDTLTVKDIESAFAMMEGAYAALKKLVLAAVEPKE